MLHEPRLWLCAFHPNMSVIVEIGRFVFWVRDGLSCLRGVRVELSENMKSGQTPHPA